EGVNYCNATRSFSAQRGQGGTHGRVVGAIATGLDKHSTRKSQMLAQSEQRFDSSCRRRITALFRVWKLFRQKHMNMTVTCITRYGQAGGWKIHVGSIWYFI